MKICIVGLGYVGLPLAIQFAQSNVTVVGLDVDGAKVDLIQRGQSYIKHIAPETIAKVLKNNRFLASTDFGHIKESDAVIICVPTPLNKNREPDISYITETGRLVAPHFSKGTLVVLESTTYPGTTDEELREVIERRIRSSRPVSISTSPSRRSAKILVILTAWLQPFQRLSAVSHPPV